MLLYVNNNGEIKDIGSTNDKTLREVYIDDETSPFKGWSEARLLCYKIAVNDGTVVMMTPYKDSRWLDIVDQLGNGHESNASDITDNRSCIIETYEDAADLRNAVMELYEMLSESEV